MKNRENRAKVVFINDELIEEDAYLWRYIDLQKFLSFIFSKSLYLARFDKFEDNKEGITLKHLYFLKQKKEIENNPIFDKIKSYISLEVSGDKMNKIDEELKEIQEFNFANCWVLGNFNSESVAMWNLYSQPNSLAIKIKYSDFKENLIKYGVNYYDESTQIICSPITYIDFQNPSHSTIKNIINNSVFIKDKSFEHEKEFRIVAREKVKEKPEVHYKKNIYKGNIERIHNEMWNYVGIELILNEFENYNFEIVHHPKSQNWAKKNIEEILKLTGINFNVNESNLELR